MQIRGRFTLKQAWVVWAMLVVASFVPDQHGSTGTASAGTIPHADCKSVVAMGDSLQLQCNMAQPRWFKLSGNAEVSDVVRVAIDCKPSGRTISFPWLVHGDFSKMISVESKGKAKQVYDLMAASATCGLDVNAEPVKGSTGGTQVLFAWGDNTNRFTFNAGTPL